MFFMLVTVVYATFILISLETYSQATFVVSSIMYAIFLVYFLSKDLRTLIDKYF
jgi:hypothetical protein